MDTRRAWASKMPSGATSRKSRACNGRRCRSWSRRSIKIGRATYLQLYACSYSTKSALRGTCGDVLAPDGLRKKPNFKPWRKITNYDRVNDGRKLSAIAASAKHDVTIARCQDHVTFLLTKNNYWNLRQPRRAQSPPVNINYGKAALRAFHACIRAIVFSLRFVRGAF